MHKIDFEIVANATAKQQCGKYYVTLVAITSIAPRTELR